MSSVNELIGTIGELKDMVNEVSMALIEHEEIFKALIIGDVTEFGETEIEETGQRAKFSLIKASETAEGLGWPYQFLGLNAIELREKAEKLSMSLEEQLGEIKDYLATMSALASLSKRAPTEESTQAENDLRRLLDDLDIDLPDTE